MALKVQSRIPALQCELDRALPTLWRGGNISNTEATPLAGSRPASGLSSISKSPNASEVNVLSHEVVRFGSGANDRVLRPLGRAI
jgi:hypothetical protein